MYLISVVVKHHITSETNKTKRCARASGFRENVAYIARNSLCPSAQRYPDLDNLITASSAANAGPTSSVHTYALTIHWLPFVE